MITARILPAETWLALEQEHQQRVGRFAEPYRQRRSAGHKHPVEDFLFTYYPHKPGQLARWHPGPGVVLVGDEAAERTGWKFYRRVGAVELAEFGLPGTTSAVTIDLDAFLARRWQAAEQTRQLLAGTGPRPGQFGCFGLHEWAMVYRLPPDDVRHDYLRLRLGSAGTDDVVERSRIRCSHFDAFRFFTPAASGRNELQPSRAAAPQLEQPGCLHANMDLYK